MFVNCLNNIMDRMTTRFNPLSSISPHANGVLWTTGVLAASDATQRHEQILEHILRFVDAMQGVGQTTRIVAP